MHGNTSRRKTFLVNLMFSRPDKFEYIWGAYIGDVNWVTYLGGVCPGWGEGGGGYQRDFTVFLKHMLNQIYGNRPL